MPPGVVLASDNAKIESSGLSEPVFCRLASHVSAGMGYFAYEQEEVWASQQLAVFCELGFSCCYEHHKS